MINVNSPLKLQTSSSATYFQMRRTQVTRNNTIDNDQSRLKTDFILKDKETLFDEVQNLKQENNYLKNRLKLKESKITYLTREVSSLINSPDTVMSRSSNKVKQSYMEKINQQDQEINELNEKLRKVINAPIPIESAAVLKQDNIKLTEIVSAMEKQIQHYEQQLHKVSVKCTAALMQCNSLKKLNHSLVAELDKLKQKDTLFMQRMQKSVTKNDEHLQVELDQAIINLRNAEKKQQNQENRMKAYQAEQLDLTEQLQKRIIELSKKNEQQLRDFEEEKIQIMQSRRQRTMIMKAQTPVDDDDEEENVKLPQKTVQIERSDLQHLARLIRLHLIADNITLEQVVKHFDAETLTLNQITDLLHHPMFNHMNDHEISVLATYLADLEKPTDTTTGTRVRSILKTLLEHYVILSDDQLRDINNTIYKRRNEINDYLLRKQPELLFQSGYLSMELYIEALISVDIVFNKQQTDHIWAKIYQQNKKFRVLQNQLFKPILIPELLQEPPPQLFRQMTSEQELVIPSITINTPVSDIIQNNPMASDEELHSDKDLHSDKSLDEDGNPMYESALDIKMVDSQDLKKKSQSNINI